MKKYYIEDFVLYCFPYEISHKLSSDNYGVLKQYVEKEFNRDEIDKIICEMVTRHPYVEKSMVLKISVMWIDMEKYRKGVYHSLEFENDNYERQNKGNMEIKYELE